MFGHLSPSAAARRLVLCPPPVCLAFRSALAGTVARVSTRLRPRPRACGEQPRQADTEAGLASGRCDGQARARCIAPDAPEENGEAKGVLRGTSAYLHGVLTYSKSYRKREGGTLRQMQRLGSNRRCATRRACASREHDAGRGAELQRLRCRGRQARDRVDHARSPRHANEGGAACAACHRA